MTIWEIINSPLGISVVAGLILWCLNRLYARAPAWRELEGTIISAVRHAEKQIPDDTPNAALARFDAALRYVLTVYEEMYGHAPPAKMERSIREGIAIVHDELDRANVL